MYIPILYTTIYNIKWWNLFKPWLKWWNLFKPWLKWWNLFYFLVSFLFHIITFFNFLKLWHGSPRWHLYHRWYFFIFILGGVRWTPSLYNYYCDKVKCYNCNKQGHRQAGCRSYRSVQRSMGQERRTGNSYSQGRYQNNSRDGRSGWTN